MLTTVLSVKEINYKQPARPSTEGQINESMKELYQFHLNKTNKLLEGNTKYETICYKTGRTIYEVKKNVRGKINTKFWSTAGEK